MTSETGLRCNSVTIRHDGQVVVEGPDLIARHGERVAVRAADAVDAEVLLDTLAGQHPVAGGSLHLDGGRRHRVTGAAGT